MRSAENFDWPGLSLTRALSPSSITPKSALLALTRLFQIPLRFSRFLILQSWKLNPFSMKVRTGVLDQAHAEAAMDKVFKDLAAGLFVAVKLDDSPVDDARALIGKYGCARRMRTLDALLLAVVLDLRRRNLFDIFVVAVKLLAEIADLEAFVVENPKDCALIGNSMDDRLSSTQLQAECQRLETEIKRLEELLEKQNIAFGIAQPARTSRALPTARGDFRVVQGPESKERKIRLFRSLFR